MNSGGFMSPLAGIQSLPNDSFTNSFTKPESKEEKAVGKSVLSIKSKHSWQQKYQRALSNYAVKVARKKKCHIC